MKKFLITIALILIFCTLCACGDDTVPPADDVESTTPAETTEAKPSETDPPETADPAQTDPPETADPAQTDVPETEDIPEQNTATPAASIYEIPKAKSAPTIDGKLDVGEWKDALSKRLSNKNTIEIAGSRAYCQGGIFRFLWDETGLYVSMEVTDKTAQAAYLSAGNGSYNSQNGTQIAIYVDPECISGEVGKLYFFSFTPMADDGKPYVGEHFIYGDGNTGKDVAEATVAASVTEEGFVIECKLDAAVFAKASPAIKLESGTNFKMANVILDIDGEIQALFVDSAWFNAPKTNTYYLIG